MNDKYLKIILSEIIPNKKIRYDLYIHFPKNEKMIRLISAGSILEPIQIEKLKSKSVESLFISKLLIQDQNLANLSIYLSEEEPEVINSIETVQVNAPDSKPMEIVDLPKNDPSPSTEQISAFKNETVTQSEEIKFQPSVEENVEEIKFTQDSTLALEERKFSAGKPESVDITRLASTIETPLEELRFGADKKEIEHKQKIKGGSEQVPDEEEFRFSRSQEQKNTETFSFSKKLESIREEIEVGKSPDLSTKRDELVRDLFAALCISKISNELIQLLSGIESLSISQRIELKDKVTPIKDILLNLSTSVNSVDSIPPEFSAKAEMNDLEKIINKVENIDALVALMAPRFERAEKAMEAALKNIGALEHSLRAMRDIPSTASKLAAQLGHSLGYNNLEFLSELALTAILYFSNEGSANSETTSQAKLYSEIIKFDEDISSSVVADSKDIISIIDFYIKEPDCDRSSKEFETAVFDSALGNLVKFNSNFNIWNAIKWKQFIEAGPTIDTHSLCAKACSIALKKSREIGL